MVEVSALSHGQADHPQTISLALNDTLAGEWRIDSTTVHDKLLIIPAALLNHGSPAIITLTVQSPLNPPTDAGLRLHSIALHANLNAYLAELQTGYNWVCGLRNELVDTIRRVLYFLENIDNPPAALTLPLAEILRTPYVVAGHEATLIFDEPYFQANLLLLKEGYIHQAIRQWATEIKTLHGIVVSAGNYATGRPEIHCWDQAGLTKLLAPPLEFTNQIAALRAKNTHLNNLEILLHKERIDSVPPVLYLDITNRCNFRCRMCYQSTSHFLRQNLSNEHMAVVIDMLPYLNEITVAGLGEPLLSKNLLPLAERAKALHCQTTIITNGSLIPANLPILKNFSTVSISFDGAVATTFETLRNRSQFKQITSNIKKLRSAAPAISLAFSVVMSRANLDELAGIVQWAADLGINAVNVTPLEHMPVFELKSSDWPLFQTQLAEAHQIAEQAGITLAIALSEKNFSPANDTRREKEALIDTLSAMAPAQEDALSLTAIAHGLHATPFNYYPAPMVFMRSSWPPITNQVTAAADAPPPTRTAFKIDLELARLEERIRVCLNEIRDRSGQTLTLPYCLDPWKLSYVKSNGTSRLCCHTDCIVGDLGGQGFKAAINSEYYRRMRQAMSEQQSLLPACKQCRAADRTMGLESIIDTCRAYGIPFTAAINPQGRGDAKP